MKSLLFLGLLALAWASSIKKPYHKLPEQQYYGEEFLHKQKSVLQLFQNIYQPDYFPEYVKIGLGYNIEENLKGYSNPKYVFDFLKYYTSGCLPKGQVFSIFYDKHQNEAIAFFRLLYSAVDFETFYKTAVWGRMYLNEGLYIYSLSVALVHRPDTWYIELPPIYEIYPYYFFNFNVFKQAHEKTGYYFGNYQYWMPRYMKQWSGPYQYVQKSYKYPYYFGKYLQNQQGQEYPYEYQQEYQGYPYNWMPYHGYNRMPTYGYPNQYYGPYSNEYYQRYYGQELPYNYRQYWQYPYKFEGKTEEGTPYYNYGPYTQQYYEQYGKLPWDFMKQFQKQTWQYPYNNYMGQYQGQNWQYPYGKNQYYSQENTQESKQYNYGPYSQQYYEKYGKFPLNYMQQYERQYPYGSNQYYTQENGEGKTLYGYRPYSEQYYQKYGKFPWFSMNKQFQNYGPSRQGYEQIYQPKYQQYQQGYQPQYQQYQQGYQPQYQQYQQGYQPQYQQYQQGYLPEYQQDYQQQYQQQYGKFPGFFKGEKSYQYGPYSQEYYQRFNKFPWFSFEKYQKVPSYSYENENYNQQTESGPYSGPYSGEFYQKFEKFPFFYMTKYFGKPMTGEFYGQQYPYFQKSFYKYTPYSGQYLQKQTPNWYWTESQGTPEYFLKRYPYGNTYQNPEQYFQRPQGMAEGFYQQERENVPTEYYQQQQEGIIINANYSNYFARFNPEYLMSYFTEDIGLNAFYYYYNIYFPFWMKNEEIVFDTQRRGEQFYYIYQQLLARYNLERISNGLGEMPPLDYKIQAGFRTALMYPNGLQFPERPNHAPIVNRYGPGQDNFDNDTLSLANIQLYERRLLDAIDSGFVLTRDGKMVPIFEPEGFEILGNLIQCNPESPNNRYYGPILVFARYLLGYSNYPLDQYNINPSVMEQYETSLRDPAFYQLFRRIIFFFQRYKQYLPKYTQEELFWNGVKIQDVKVDKLVTYFDYFYSDISNVMQGKGQMGEVPIRVRQYRLNHKPFNYYLNVVSESPVDAVVRVFLGPKYDVNGKPININTDRLSFVELDKFHYSLVPGLNMIERNSRQFYGYVPDRTTYKELFMQIVSNPVMTPVEIQPQIQWGIPQRLMLPKGTQEGQAYQMYFIVTPYQPIQKYKSKIVSVQRPILYWDTKLDSLPYGYPFDRPIDETVFYVPNSYFKDVVIYNEFSPEFVGEYLPNYNY